MTEAPADIDALIDAAFDKYSRHVNPAFAALAKFMGFETVEDRAEGALVYDVRGREYIDCLGGPGVFLLGHRHPKLVAVLKDQLDRMPLSSRLLLSRWQAEAAEKIAQVTPGDLQCTFLCNSGAEAVEGALKLARLHTGKPGVVANIGAFHGKTFGALSASGRDVYKTPFEPLLPGFRHVPFGDAAAIRDAIDDTVGAVIIEPIQSEAGIIVPPDGYLREVRAICDEAGVLLILDEVQTGLGRTGIMFACNAEDVVPDIITLGKALGGGVMPVGAFTATELIWDAYRDNPLIHTSTFGGNPLACRAASAALEVIAEERVCDLARERGEQLIQGLRQVAAEYEDIILEVRGRGLLIGVEFGDSDVGGIAIACMGARGVLTAYTLNDPKVLRFEPPAVITPEQVDTVVAAFGEGAKAAADLARTAS
ncbi:MAG: aminotransferase class III-fold pyridoxal phosphate-dependent enzyme [Armatimonadota bacterium]